MANIAFIATAARPPSPDDPALARLDAAHWIEVRGDLMPGVAPDPFREFSRARLIFNLRSVTEGGTFADGDRERQRQLLRAAAAGFDLITLEADRDLSPPVLAAIPSARRLITWRGCVDNPADLHRRLHDLGRVGAKLFRFETTATRALDGLVPMSFLHDLRRDDVTAFALGREGFWTRFIAPRFGAPVVHCNLETSLDAFEIPTLQSLVEDYGLPRLRPVKELLGIIGNHLDGSLSPRLHNRAYEALDLHKLYLPFYADSLRDFWTQIVEPKTFERIGLSLGGFTVASPHKETILELARAGSGLVSRARSGNAVFMRDGIWIADSADSQGVLAPLRARGVSLPGRKAAVVGCGGSGRAMAAALDQAGADVTLVNRGRERGRLAVRLLDLPFVPLSEFLPARFNLVVNATPVGRNGEGQPFDVASMHREAVVVDLVYGSKPTPLIAQTRALGRTAIDGREVLLSQVIQQFWLMTGREMPRPLAREAIGGLAQEFPTPKHTPRVHADLPSRPA